MKRNIRPLAVAMTVSLSVLAFGCNPVVTDINATLDTKEVGENEVVVNRNKDFQEVEIKEVPDESTELAMADEETESDTGVNQAELENKDTKENNDASLSEEDKDEKDTDGDTDNEGDEDGEDGDNKEGEDGEEGEDTEATPVDVPNVEAPDIPEEFDPQFYAERNPDVVAAVGDSPDALYKHYIDYGQAEGRCRNVAEQALIDEAPNP